LSEAVSFRFVLEKFMRDLDRKEVLEDQEVLAGVVTGIVPHLPSFSKSDTDAVTQKLIAVTGRSALWFDKLFRLSIPEIRRALRTRPNLPNRRDAEALYPTDGWLGGYLLYCQESEAPLGWHFWCGVALLSLIARRNFYWDRGRYFLFLNHYIFLLGQSGLTKSTTIGQAMGVFEEVQSIIAAMGTEGREPFYQSPERITPERLLVDLSNWTFTVTGPPRRDTILFMVSDELTTLLGRDVKGSDRLANFLTDIYMGKRSFRDSTIVGGDRKLTNLACTCLFASTASAVRRAITDNMFSEGFMARVITAPRKLIDRHGEYDTPPPTDPVERRTLSETLVPWALLNTEIEIRPTHAARDWFKSWYSEHRNHPPDEEKLVAFWQRKPDHLNRLAGILKLSQVMGCPPDVLPEIREAGVLWIDDKVMQYALHLIEDEERRLPEAFSQIGAREESRDVWQLQAVIEKHFERNSTPISHVDLFHNCRHIIKDAPHMMMMLQTLLLNDVIEVVRVGNKVKSFYQPKRKQNVTAAPSTDPATPAADSGG